MLNIQECQSIIVKILIDCSENCIECLSIDECKKCGSNLIL